MESIKRLPDLLNSGKDSFIPILKWLHFQNFLLNLRKTLLKHEKTFYPIHLYGIGSCVHKRKVYKYSFFLV